jgi:DNA modification methylase
VSSTAPTLIGAEPAPMNLRSPQLDIFSSAAAVDSELDGGLVRLPPGVVARRLATLDWGFASAQGYEHSHGLHPYPAKFVAQLPRQAIRLLSLPAELVLDPFSGGGTSGVEALLAGRDYIGIDANPVGNAIGRAKTAPLAGDDLHSLRLLEARLLALQEADLNGQPPWLPSIPNVEKWYAAGVFRALGIVRTFVTEVQGAGARGLALLAFVQASARVSFQESETRYSSKPRAIDVLEVPRAVVSELRRMRRIAEEVELGSTGTATFLDADAREADSYATHDASIGMIVTSPPYPNTYDYHLYHRFRLFWLGEDPSKLRRVEIGSHLKNQGVKDPVGAYLDDMRAVLRNCLRVLMPDRYAVFVVGDGLFKGEVFETARNLRRVAEEVGFEHVTSLDRAVPEHRRSVTKPGRRLTHEQLLVLRRPADGPMGRTVGPNYQLFPYEQTLQLRELTALGGSPCVQEDGTVTVVDRYEIARAAFVHAVVHAGRTEPTFQRRLEGMPGTESRRKNSTYFAHGIHRYKGKFYPQLAKSLLNLSGIEPGQALVLDPFGGSGTVALEAVLNGYDAFSIDCNPVAAAIARAKVGLATADLAAIQDDLSRLRAAVLDAPPAGRPALSQFVPDVKDELERWFPRPVLAKLDWLLGAIRRDPRSEATALWEVLVSDLVREVSQQEPKDLRIRRRSTPIADAPVYQLFLDRLSALEVRLAAFQRNADSVRPSAGTGLVVQGDSGDPRTFDVLEGRAIDAVISSPPYAAALPYVDTDRLSLAAVFGYGAPARRPLERTMIGSREIGGRDRVAFETILGTVCEELPLSTTSFLSDFRDAVVADTSAGFRRQQAPAVLLRYFLAMSDVLTNVAARLHPGAYCWLVLGDSRSTIGGRGWTIPTVDEVANIAKHRGLRLRDRLPITVTREDVLHSRHAITRNEILQLQA